MFWFLSLPLTYQLFILYILAINVIAFFTFFLDKFKASGNFRRVRERTLWFLSALGGSVGALTGMYVFRHKTKKPSFQAGLFLILFLQIALVFFWLNLL